MPDGEPYPSGTAYEVLTAIEARKAGALPDVFVFRYPRPPSVTLDEPDREAEVREQWARLKKFFERWFVTQDGQFKAAFQNYEDVDAFEQQVETLLRRWLEDHVLGAGAVAWSIATKGSPFRGLEAFGAKHAEVFFGRDRDIERAVERFTDPQSEVEMATLGSRRIASTFLMVRSGGDVALLKGIMKALLALDEAGVAGAVDHAFIAEHTEGFEAFADDLSLVGTGQVDSVARPGGNTTGVSMLGRLLDIKRLEVLHELAPRARRIGVITDGTRAARGELPKFEEAARRLGLAPTVVHVETVDGIAPGMAALEGAGVEAVQFFASTFLQATRARFVAEMTRMNLPAMYEWPETVEEGGLSSYGPRLTLCFRHVAVLVSKVLKGARPADLPIEQPNIFTLAINVGAARRIGFVVPETMLLRADLLVD